MSKIYPRSSAVLAQNGRSRNHPRYFSTSYAFWLFDGSYPWFLLPVAANDRLDPLDHLCQYA